MQLLEAGGPRDRRRIIRVNCRRVLILRILLAGSGLRRCLLVVHRTHQRDGWRLRQRRAPQLRQEVLAVLAYGISQLLLALRDDAAEGLDVEGRPLLGSVDVVESGRVVLDSGLCLEVFGQGSVELVDCHVLARLLGDLGGHWRLLLWLDAV